MKIILLIGLVFFVALILYVRFAPIGQTHFAARSTDKTKEVEKLGGYRVNFGPIDTQLQDQIFDAILQNPRTVEVETNLHGTRIFVSRSALWRFPDVTHIYEVDGDLILDGHLVYGRSDLGVNKARIKALLAGLQ